MKENIERLLEFIAALDPSLTVFLYVVVSGLATAILLPTSIIMMVAGFLFGGVFGCIYGMIGITLGAMLSLLCSRYVARDWVMRRFQVSQKLLLLDSAISKNDTKITLLLRLCPVFPYSVVSYGLGLTHVRFWSFVKGSLLGSIPMVLFFSNVGSKLNEIAAITSGEREKSPAEWVYIGITLALALVIIYYLGRFAKKALQQAHD